MTKRPPTRAASSGTPTVRRLPGWFVGLALVLPTLVTWIYFDLLQSAPAAVQQVAYAVGKTIQFLLPLAAWIYVRPREALRIRSPRGVGWGLAFGACVFVAVVLLYQFVLSPAGVLEPARPIIQRKVLGFGIRSPLTYFLLGAFYSVVHALLEEIYWRWFVFAQLCTNRAWNSAAILSSLGFMAHHVLLMAHFFSWSSPWTYLFSISVAVGGYVWAALYHRAGSLLGPWLSHALVDAAIFTVGYRLVVGAL